MSNRMGSDDRKRRTRSLIERDGDSCHYCEQTLNDKNRTIEHLIPRSHEGSNSLWNLVLACKPCNELRGSMDYEIFKGMMPWIVAAREPIEPGTWLPFESLTVNF